MINFRKNDENSNESNKKDLKYETESLHLNIFKDKKSYEKKDSDFEFEKSKDKKPKFNFERKEKVKSPNAAKEVFSMTGEGISKIKKAFVEGGNLSIKIMAVLWSITIVSGILYFNSLDSDTPKVVFERKSVAKESEKQNIYIFSPEGDKLVSSELQVDRIENKNVLIKKTLDETIKKLKELNKIPNINERVEVFCYLVDNTIYLDLPEKLFDKVKSPKDELLLIYSFVNTMTNVDTNIKTVKILINGVDVDKVKYANLKRDFRFRKDI